MNWSMPFRHWRAVTLAAPFITLGLYLYMGLPSSFIFPEGSMEVTQPWHSGYPGWYDLLLGVTLLLHILAAGVRPPDGAMWFCLMALVGIVASILISGLDSGWAPLIDAILYWGRFTLPFFATMVTVLKYGGRRTESLLFGSGILLIITSLFVMRLQYGSFNRLYASGMTVGSFSQVILVLFAIALTQKNLQLMALSLVCLIFTFSRVALVVWAISLACFYYRKSAVSRLRGAFYGLLLGLVFAAVLLVINRNPEFQTVIESRMDPDELATGNGRSQIWQYGIELLTSGLIPLTGIGFNRTPMLLEQAVVSTENHDLYFASFHSIFFEYGFGLGLFSLPIFAVLLWRLWLTWRHRCYLSFLIFLIFLLTQSVDFTFYHPKEVVIWAAFLGLAEGEWIAQRGRMSAAKITASPRNLLNRLWSAPETLTSGVESKG